jgi:hypothetical protein
MYEYEFTGEHLAMLPIFPNVTDFEVHFASD